MCVTMLGVSASVFEQRCVASMRVCVYIALQSKTKCNKLKKKKTNKKTNNFNKKKKIKKNENKKFVKKSII